jgi:hypothetical protein
MSDMGFDTRESTDMNGHRSIPSLLGVLLVVTAAVGADARGSRNGAAGGRPEVVARASLAVATDGGEPTTFQIEGVATEEGIRFEGSRHDSNRQVTVAWNWIADLDPRGNARLAGLASVVNHASEKREFDVRVSMPIDPLITEGSRIGGRVRVTLVMDGDGGRLDVPFGQSVWSAMVDDEVGKTLHNGPFAMGGSGAGTAVTDASFGAPYPGLDSASVEDGFGIRHRFRLTGGEEARFDSEVILGGDEADFIRRRTDGPVRIGSGDDRVVIQVGGGSKGAASVRRGARPNRSNRSPIAAPRRELKITPSGG